DIAAKAIASLKIGIEEAVYHRESIALLVRQASADQRAGPAIHAGFAIFDDVGFDRRLLYHVGKVDLVHLGHAAMGMTRGEIALEQPELLISGPGLAGAHHKIAVAANEPALSRV